MSDTDSAEVLTIAIPQAAIDALAALLLSLPTDPATTSPEE